MPVGIQWLWILSYEKRCSTFLKASKLFSEIISLLKGIRRIKGCKTLMISEINTIIILDIRPDAILWIPILIIYRST